MSSLSAIIERIVAGRWIAGEQIDDALREAKRFNAAGIRAIINELGEDYTDIKSVSKSVHIFERLISRIHSEHILADVSVKPTQLGLLISKKLFEENLRQLSSYANSVGIFLWVDMEDKPTVEDTIDVFFKIAPRRKIGLCIQSYMKRSMSDIRRLVKAGFVVRLVKGAYSLSDETYSTRREITENYLRLMLYLFRNLPEFTIATHDLGIIEKALKLNLRYKRKVTYAMLKGVRNRYLRLLSEKGEHVSVYIPFGREWVAYSYRRLREAGHMSLILKSIFEKQGI
ncbi:MAG: proline dehydrogenase family protein [Candidatus Micrarchaeaceae archaeon]